MKKCLIVGNGGREASMALKLANSYSIYAYMSFKNPTIMRAIEDTKGDYFIGDILDGKSIAEYAEKVGVDIAVVNNDNSLAAGVVDCLKKKNILTFGPTRKGARIEWDKSFTRDLTKRINEKLNPFYIVVDDIQYLDTSINEFKERNLEIVVKPVGLTGGKGVKVMGKHLSDYVQAYEYARKNLISDGKVLLEEKINGYEFTIMGISDGNNIVISPVTYDYPFRYNDDIGPGTGGMGCFTLETKKLPFLSDDIINECKNFMKDVIKYLNKDGIEFNGVINGGFFITNKDELRLMEFNSRIGDPECINIMEGLESDFSDVIENCCNMNLSNDNCKFKNEATMVVYLVAPNYALNSNSEPIKFTVNDKEIVKNNAKFICANCLKTDNESEYISVGNSRLAALALSDKNITIAREKIYYLLENFVDGNVEFRTDIASEKTLIKMSKG